MTDAPFAKHQLPWLVVVFVVGFVVGIGLLTFRGQDKPAAIYISPPAPTLTAAPTPTPGSLRIYVSGAVQNPAVYELPHTAILQDAIFAAGGFAEDAEQMAVNLALPLRDGMQIFVPQQGEAGDLPVQAESMPGEANPVGLLVNINTATLAELEGLPGIGPATAEKIIADRQSNGPFNSIDEIMRVSGIGPAKLEQIRDLITVR